MNPDTTISVSLLISSISCLSVIVALVRSIRSKGAEDAQGIVKANVKLDTICQNINEIRVDYKTLNSRIDELAKKQIEHDIKIKQLEERAES